MRNARRLAIAILVAGMGSAFAQEEPWPPNAWISPENPGTSDVIILTFSDTWPHDNVPQGVDSVQVQGQSIYVTLGRVLYFTINYWATPWQEACLVGPLAAGCYDVYVRHGSKPFEKVFTFCVAEGGVCLKPGSRVVSMLSYRGQTVLEAGRSGTILCVDPEGQLLVSWDLWHSGDGQDTDGACVAEPIGSYPESSTIWVDPNTVDCYFDACGTFQYTETGGLTFTPDTSDAGVSVVRVVPDVLDDPDVAGVVIRGDRVRLRGLINPRLGHCRWRWNVPGSGPCVERPMISACGESDHPACDPESHISPGDRIVYVGPVLYEAVLAPLVPGASGTVICCSGDNALVCWDLWSGARDDDAGACAGRLPLYTHPGSLKWVTCCALARPVDLCGTVVERVASLFPSMCPQRVVFRPDDIMYGEVQVQASLQVGDRARVRGLWRSIRGCPVVMIPECPPPQIQILHPIISPDCQQGGSCDADFAQYEPPNEGLSPSSIQPGQILILQFGGANQGTAAIAPGWGIRYYASVDTNITSDDHFLYETVADFGIGPGEQKALWEAFVFPGTVPAGQYYIGWIFDPDNSVCESDESNNAGYVRGIRLTVRGGGGSCNADFAQYEPPNQGLFPSSIRPGQTLSMIFGGANRGTATIAPGWRIRYYASVNTNITSGDYFLYEAVADFGIGAGVYMAFSEAFVFPSSVPSGQYYVGWIFDPGNEVCESNESNNAGYVKGVRLTVVRP